MRTITGLSFTIVAIAAVATLAYGQSLGKSRQAGKPTRSIDASYVTKAEAQTVLARVRDIVYRVVLKKTAPKQPIALQANVCSRKELIDALFTIFKATETEFRVTPERAMFDAGVLSIPAGDPSRPRLEKLIAWGFVGRVDPLATSAKPGLTPDEFGDAIGYFLCRLSDLTHTPSIQYSPAMMGGGG